MIKMIDYQCKSLNWDECSSPKSKRAEWFLLIDLNVLNLVKPYYLYLIPHNDKNKGAIQERAQETIGKLQSKEGRPDSCVYKFQFWYHLI